MAGTDIARKKLDQPSDKPSLFQKGHPRYGGRQFRFIVIAPARQSGKSL
jgi:hypothetical protein